MRYKDIFRASLFHSAEGQYSLFRRWGMGRGLSRVGRSAIFEALATRSTQMVILYRVAMNQNSATYLSITLFDDAPRISAPDAALLSMKKITVYRG